MKVLDKVYIHLTPHLGLLEATEIPVDAPNEQEYIRKDALLEWLKDMRFMANWERAGAYQNVIDKLNKM